MTNSRVMPTKTPEELAFMAHMRSIVGDINLKIEDLLRRLNAIEDIVEQIKLDHSYIDNKTGRKLHLVPSDMTDGIKTIRDMIFSNSVKIENIEKALDKRE